MKAVQIEKLSKLYGKNRGIQDLDLTVEEGDCMGFVGPNGAGKSTTMRILLGLIFPSSGSAKVFGKDVVKEKTQILREVGYLPSEAVFYSGLKVKEILSLSSKLRGMDCSAEADRLMERLKLDPDRRVEELSYGNRKKVAIVCALQSNPRLLILDEPTGGLDPFMQREFFEIIRERNREGVTVFLSSHILSEVQRSCKRAAVIREGKVIACDSVEKLAQSSARRVTLYGEAELGNLPGVKDLEKGEGVLSFLFSGDMKGLLQRLSEGHIRDLRVAEPDLEEIFLHYYETEEGK